MYFKVPFVAAELLGPALGYFLMQRSLWIPMFVNLSCGVFSISICCLLPSTGTIGKGIRGQYTKVDPGDEEEEEEEEEDYDDDAGEDPQYTTDPTHNSGSSLADNILSLFNHLKRSIGFVLHSRSVMILVLTFFLANFARDSMYFILQYVTNRYSWSIAKVIYYHFSVACTYVLSS